MDMGILVEVLSCIVLHIISNSLNPIDIGMDSSVRFASERENCY
jgi:hypothetical protein